MWLSNHKWAGRNVKEAVVVRDRAHYSRKYVHPRLTTLCRSIQLIILVRCFKWFRGQDMIFVISRWGKNIGWGWTRIRCRRAYLDIGRTTGRDWRTLHSEDTPWHIHLTKHSNDHVKKKWDGRDMWLAWRREEVECVWNLMAHGDAREGKWRGNWRMEWVAITLTLPRNVVYPVLLPLMRTPRLAAVDWTDAPADLNGLVRLGERRSLVSAHVPSHFKRTIHTRFWWWNLR